MFIRSNLSNESITKIFLKNTRKIAWIFLSMQFIELGFLWTIYRSKIIPSSTFSCYHCIIPYPFLCASKCFSSIKYLLFDLITSPWLYHKRCPNLLICWYKFFSAFWFLGAVDRAWRKKTGVILYPYLSHVWLKFSFVYSWKAVCPSSNNKCYLEFSLQVISLCY